MNTNSIRRRVLTLLIRRGESGPIVRAGCRAADTTHRHLDETHEAVEASRGLTHHRRSTGRQFSSSPQGLARGGVESRRHRLINGSNGTCEQHTACAGHRSLTCRCGGAGVATGPRVSIRRRVFEAPIRRGRSGPIAGSRAADTLSCGAA